jgi:hypothetical protein
MNCMAMPVASGKQVHAEAISWLLADRTDGALRTANFQDSFRNYFRRPRNVGVILLVQCRRGFLTIAGNMKIRPDQPHRALVWAPRYRSIRTCTCKSFKSASLASRLSLWRSDAPPCLRHKTSYSLCIELQGMMMTRSSVGCFLRAHCLGDLNGLIRRLEPAHVVVSRSLRTSAVPKQAVTGSLEYATAF